LKCRLISTVPALPSPPAKIYMYLYSPEARLLSMVDPVPSETYILEGDTDSFTAVAVIGLNAPPWRGSEATGDWMKTIEGGAVRTHSWTRLHLPGVRTHSWVRISNQTAPRTHSWARITGGGGAVKVA